MRAVFCVLLSVCLALILIGCGGGGNNGGVLWTFSQPNAAAQIGLSVAADNTVHFVAQTVYALDGDTGTKLWERAGNFRGLPVVAADGTLFLYARDAAEPAWESLEYIIGIR